MCPAAVGMTLEVRAQYTGRCRAAVLLPMVVYPATDKKVILCHRSTYHWLPAVQHTIGCLLCCQLSLLGPLRPQPTKIWKRKFVKLMVVGDSGLGKTTLISALLSKPGEQLQVRGIGHKAIFAPCRRHQG